MRGLAILFVMGFHASFLWSPPSPIVRDMAGYIIFENWVDVLSWLNPLRKGWAGVELFLVISGFLIHLIYLRSRETFRYPDFFRRRFWRIYPPYLIILLLLFFIKGSTITDLIWHLLMAHNLYDLTHFSINGSFWSIALEVQLYILYPLVILVSRRVDMRNTFVIALILNIALTLLGKFNPEIERTFWFGTFVFKLWYVWIAGAWLAEMYHDGKQLFKKPLLVSLISFVLFVISDINFVSEHFTTMLATLSSVALMDFLLHRPVTPVTIARATGDRMLAFTGMISYSLYLVHQPIFEYCREMSSGYLSLIIAIVLSFLAAFAGYMILEKPSIAMGKRLAGQRLQQKGA